MNGMKPRAHPPEVVLTEGRRFRRYKRDGLKAERSARIEDDPVQKVLIEAWRGYWKRILTFNGWEGEYEGASDIISQISYSADDIQRLSISIPRLKSMMTRNVCNAFDKTCGIFLSAVVNNGSDGSYILDFSDQPIKTDKLAYRNLRILEIRGGKHSNIGMECMEGIVHVKDSVLVMAGWRMRGGQLIIDGCGGFALGLRMQGGCILAKGGSSNMTGADMRGGEILVFGNTTTSTGTAMSGGIIKIAGNVGSNLGEKMSGGEIHVFGEIASIGNVLSGKIFHKGRLIVDK
jgi:hypothetical protein